jgi:hypothetical protein
MSNWLGGSAQRARSPETRPKSSPVATASSSPELRGTEDSLTSEEQSNSEFLSASDARGDLLDLAAIYTSVLPVFGGAISNVLSGWSQQRRMERVREVLRDLFVRVNALRTRVDEEYVKSDEFEDLLDQTLRRVASERSKEKRRIYREVLAGALTERATSYDEQLRMLRALDQVQSSHFQVLAAMLDGGLQMPSLLHRLKHMPNELVVDLVDQLATLGVIKIASGGARVTPFGHRLVALVKRGN